MSKPLRLSHSGSQTYQTCSLKYKLHYLDKIRPTYAYSFLPFGGAIDKAMNYILESIKDGKPYSDYNIRFEQYWTQFELNHKVFNLKENAEVIRYLDSDLDETLLNDKEKAYPPHLKSWTSLLYKGRTMLDNYVRDFVPQIEEVVSVQQEISITSEDGTQLYGLIDFVAKLKGVEGYVICDNKTSASKYPKNSVSVSPQLSTYSFALGPRKGAYVVSLKKAPHAVQVVVDDINEATEEATVKELEQVAHNIKGGVFEANYAKCERGHFGRRCPYFNLCRNGGMKELEILND
jgi:PD-(D/E)XK nuclease superfamily